MAFSYYERDSALAQNRLESGEVGDNVAIFYFAGLEANLKLLPKHYPGWIIRLYHDIEEDDPLMGTLCEYACRYPDLDLCDIKNLPTTILEGNFFLLF